MARYHEIAAEANDMASQLLAMVPSTLRVQAAEKLARLFNFGIRVSPRAVHSTVRINALQVAMRGLPVRCRLEERQGDRGTYKVLVTEPPAVPTPA
jgi:hypothetical protein